MDAAMAGSRSLAPQAPLLDPVVHGASAEEVFLDEALTIHRLTRPRSGPGCGRRARHYVTLLCASASFAALMLLPAAGCPE